MRFALPTLLASAAVSLAAPVPDDLKGDKAKLEQLWNDLAAPRWVDRARAVYELLDHSKGVEFLSQKVVPVNAPADDLKKWLKAINSDDEKEWKPALAELEYHDPRTALTPAEQVELVNTDAGKKHLMNIWMPNFLESHRGVHRMTLQLKDGKVRSEWYVGDEWAGTEFDPKDYFATDRAAWQRAALAAHVLHRADTKDARTALTRLADGHKDARPTRLATSLLKAKVPEPAAEFTDKHWDALLGFKRADLVPAELVGAVFTLREAKNVPAVLKAKLPAIKATKEQVTKWVQALDTDGDDRRSALAELCYFRPSLALTLGEQMDLLTTHRGRAWLFQLWWQDFGVPPPQSEFSQGCVFTATDDGLTAAWPRKEVPPLVAPVPELSKQTCVQWQRARLAILALERMKSDAAKEVLKQLADGHPDILPTKDAKAALGRLK
jgi:hypothetical protein